MRHAAGTGLLTALLSSSAPGATLNFQLLTWNDASATAELPSAAGRKPSATLPAGSDWLVFTSDDATLTAVNNPAGALSHNFIDLTGAGGAGFNLAASLAGELTLRLEPSGGSRWEVSVTALTYTGQANAMQAMNEFLVVPGSAAARDSAFKVDGLGNAGFWTAAASNHWAIEYSLDFYFAANSDGEPNPADIDLTFNDKTQEGFLIPVACLTAGRLAEANLEDSAGLHSGDFAQYLLDEIAPRLPANATYLLLTQMPKVHPDFAETGLPITTAGWIGNTTIAYTTQTLTGPPRILSQQIENGQPVIRFTGSAGQSFQIQRSGDLIDWETIESPVLESSGAGVLKWTDLDRAVAQRFYRVIAVTP